MSPDLSTPQPPSKRKLAATTAIALSVAIVLLATVVLPAEYGLDPLHTGAMLGLSALSAPLAAKAIPVPDGATEFKPVQDGPIGYYNAAYKVDSAELKLGPYEYLEYKYRVEKDASMLFSWSASAAVTHDFHGDFDDVADSPDLRIGSAHLRIYDDPTARTDLEAGLLGKIVLGSHAFGEDNEIGWKTGTTLRDHDQAAV